MSQNILTALREIAEEKEQSKSQEDIYAEESIYKKFTSNKDTALFPSWHAATWKDKLKLLDKFSSNDISNEAYVFSSHVLNITFKWIL